MVRTSHRLVKWTFFCGSRRAQARNQDFLWGGGGEGANEAKVDKTTEIYFVIV